MARAFQVNLLILGEPSARRILEDDAKLAAIKRYIVDGVETGAIPQISKMFPFDKIADAHRYLESIWQGGRDDLINSLIVDFSWIGGFEHLLHLGFRFGTLRMCL